MNMSDNETDTEMSPVDAAYAWWSEDPAIRYLINQVAEKSDPFGLEHLLESAFQAGWSASHRKVFG
jgi:hypothetical protein